MNPLVKLVSCLLFKLDPLLIHRNHAVPCLFALVLLRPEPPLSLPSEHVLHTSGEAHECLVRKGALDRFVSALVSRQTEIAERIYTVTKNVIAGCLQGEIAWPDIPDECNFLTGHSRAAGIPPENRPADRAFLIVQG